MSVNKKVAVLGGDKRQFYICKLLAQKGLHIFSLGVDMQGAELENVTIIDSLELAMNRCDIVIGPIPFSKQKDMIYSNHLSLSIDELIKLIRSNHTIIGGNINDKIIGAVEKQKGSYFDFMKEDSVAVKNAIATAEGTIAEAIKLSEINLFESKCLVLGYGRCAKALASRLKSLGAFVTVSARSEEQRNQAKNDFMCAIDIVDTQTKLSEFDFIFNSIPAMILTSQWIQFCKEDAVIIDIASNPGGTDFKECEKIGIKAVLALGLPGRYSPKTSAQILVDSICHLLPQ